MADPVPPNVVSLLKDLVEAVVMQQAQIAELQTDRTTLLGSTEKIMTAVADLQSHAESVSGDAGLTSQLGDLSTVPALHEQLTAALPAPAETAPAAASSTATTAETAAAANQDAAPQPAAA